jgi:hypothetical protein
MYLIYIIDTGRTRPGKPKHLRGLDPIYLFLLKKGKKNNKKRAKYFFLFVCAVHWPFSLVRVLSLSLSTRHSHSPLSLWNASPASETAAAPPVSSVSLSPRPKLCLFGTVLLIFDEWVIVIYLLFGLFCWFFINELIVFLGLFVLVLFRRLFKLR